MSDRGLIRFRTAVALVLLSLSACGGGSAVASSPSPSSASPQQTSPSPVPSSAPAVQPTSLDSISSRYGQVLADGQSRVLYLFTADKAGDSTCYDACATAWPPYLTVSGAAFDAMHGASASLTGSTTRKDGTAQVTYNGHPLYYFVGDKKPGEITCQAVTEYGGAWYVVDPSGNAITKS